MANPDSVPHEPVSPAPSTAPTAPATLMLHTTGVSSLQDLESWGNTRLLSPSKATVEETSNSLAMLASRGVGAADGIGIKSKGAVASPAILTEAVGESDEKHMSLDNGAWWATEVLTEVSQKPEPGVPPATNGDWERDSLESYSNAAAQGEILDTLHALDILESDILQPYA